MDTILRKSLLNRSALGFLAVNHGHGLVRNYNAEAGRFADREGFYRAAEGQVRRFCQGRGIRYEG